VILLIYSNYESRVSANPLKLSFYAAKIHFLCKNMYPFQGKSYQKSAESVLTFSTYAVHIEYSNPPV
jgi:hypothetical protein